jgi:hypothetical protein
MLTTARSLGLVLGLAAAVAAAADRREAGVHEHGAGELSVALDGNDLEISLEGPADNFVGFEYAPRTAAERKALADAEATLRAPDRLFVLPAAAGCRLQSATVEAPHADTGDAAKDSAPAGKAVSDDKDHGDDHDDEHGDEDGHSEFSAVYAWRCGRPEALDSLRVQVFARFPGTERLDAQVATPAGQKAVTLKPSAPVLRLKP